MCYVYYVRGSAAMWLLKHYWTSPVEAVIKTRLVLPTEYAKSKEGCLTSFSTIINKILEWLAMDNNLPSDDADAWSFEQSSSAATRCSLQPWTRFFMCDFVYVVKILNGLFIEGVHRLICQSLRQRWSTN